MDAAKFRELWGDDQLESVSRSAADSWRHGCYGSDGYDYGKRGTCWAVQYCLSTNGADHGLRDNNFEFYGQVKPVKKVVETIEYVSVKET